MAKNFGEIAFSDAVKKLQEQNGSRKNYEQMEKIQVKDGLSENEKSFIEHQNSFYMSTIGESDFPYIQHRGGPKGFVKVLDAKRIGFIDFKGNMQYISVGNLATNNKVALIMVDYPTRSRLKIFAKAEIVDLNEDPNLYNFLDLKEYKFRPERMMILHIEAFDWNCPQHITPRYTLEEIKESFSSQATYISDLEAENSNLRTKLKNAGLL